MCYRNMRCGLRGVWSQCVNVKLLTRSHFQDARVARCVKIKHNDCEILMFNFGGKRKLVQRSVRELKTEAHKLATLIYIYVFISDQN